MNDAATCRTINALRSVWRRSVARAPDPSDGDTDSYAAQRRDRSEDDTGRHRHGQRIEQDRVVDRDFGGACREPRDEDDEQIHAPAGDRQPERARRESRGACSRSAAAQQPAAAAGAERTADRAISRSRRDHAGQHQVGDAGADDQQHEPGGAEQHQQRGAEVDGQLVLQRTGDRAVAARGGIRRRDARSAIRPRRGRDPRALWQR